MNTATTIEQLEKMSFDYMKLHWSNGGASEFDKSINEISRAKIMVLNTIWDNVYLYKVNVYSENEIHCVKYTGQKIYNFSFDFALDHENKELISLMEDPKAYSDFAKIFDRAGELGCVCFQWS